MLDFFSFTIRNRRGRIECCFHNCAENLVINSLKYTFFADDNLEHMAFGVIGKWGETGVTSVRVMAF